MAMAAPSAQRQPFGELGSARLQALSATKNRQNAITDMLASPSKSKSSSSKPLFNINIPNTPTKRPFTSDIFDDEDFDSENVDPSLTSSKRMKNVEGSAMKKATPFFHLSVDTKPASSHAFAFLSNNATTPTSPLAAVRPDAPSSFSGPVSAPAGRSPKHKRIGILSRKRTSLSPFKRIDPPSFGRRQASSDSSSGGLPFSLDAALSGTLASHQPAREPEAAKAKPATITDAVPKGWMFEIHEDTPDEEAATIMEHSTCILDISSDDEEGPSRRDLDRGKENVPPLDHNGPNSSSASVSANAKPRRSLDADAMTDEGEDRAPLGSLPAEEFYAHGLDATSIEIIAPEAEADAEESTREQDSAEAPAQDAVVATAETAQSTDPEAHEAFAIAEDNSASGHVALP